MFPVVHTGVVENVRLCLVERRRPAVVVFPQAHSPHQDFGQEHVLDPVRPIHACVVVGDAGLGGKVGAKTVEISIDARHSGVKVVAADALCSTLGRPVKEMSLQRPLNPAVLLLHVCLLPALATQVQLVSI